MRRLVPFVAAALLASVSACSEPAAKAPPEPPVAAPPEPPKPPPPEHLADEVSWQVRSSRVLRDETFATSLGRVGVDFTTAGQLLAALSGSLDPKKLRTGDEFRVTTQGGRVEALEYRRGPVDEYRVRREGDRFVGGKVEFDVRMEVVEVTATLQSSLWEAMRAAGEAPQLALNFADVFAWDVDFYMDPRKGDTLRIVVEKYVHDGRLIRYGEILAAEYAGSLTGDKRVYRWVDPAKGVPAYFAADGSSTRRAFLKSPLKFANVTSKYGGRMHPVLKFMKKHEGVDYGAPTGTPIWAVADGVVTKAGWGGGCGNMVSIRHANGLETVYCHLSAIGEGVKQGVRVPQKKVIGLVGSTGLSTGPHLHYAVKKGGAFVNPLELKFPPAEPLKPEQIVAFQAEVAPMIARLERMAVAAAPTPSVATPAAQN